MSVLEPVSTRSTDPATETFVRWARRMTWQILLFGLIAASGPLMLKASVQFNGGRALFDFRGGLYNAGVAILHGRSFYQSGFLAHQAAIMHAGGIGRGETYSNPFSIPVYPAFANLAVVPLSLLPFWLASVLYSALSIGAMLAGLWLLGVRDWRCMAVALLSWPFLFGAFLGAVGPFLVLGAGAAWRWRARAWPCALAIATIVAAKIFPWPLGVWLLLTRRFKAAALSVVACLAITLGAWAVIGFHGLAQYPQMLSDMTLLQEGRAVSVVTVMLIAGVPPAVAHVCAMALAGVILTFAWRLARRPGGDRQAFGLAIIAALTATPIVWEHYMVLLFVPIALASPQLSALWLVPLASPLALSVSRSLIPDGNKVQAYSPNALRQALLWLVLEAIVAVCLCTTSRQRSALWTHLRSCGPRRRRNAPRGGRAPGVILAELNPQERLNA